VAVSEIANANGKRCSSAVCAATLLSGVVFASASPARAADYVASNEAELRQAIVDANANGDASSTITLIANITITDPTAFTAISKSLTIDTATFSVSGAVATGTAAGTSLSFLGGPLVVSGAMNGGNAAAISSNATGGAGLALNGGSLDNSATVIGGAGGFTQRSVHGTAGVGGSGAALTNSTLVNRGALIGGLGGQMNNQGSSGSGASRSSGGGGTGLVMTGGSLDNLGVVRGGEGGSNINSPSGADNSWGGGGGTGAALTGGTHSNSGNIVGGTGGRGANQGGSAGAGPGGTGLTLRGDAGLINRTGAIITGGQGTVSLPGGGPASTGGAGANVSGATLENYGTITGGSSGSTAVNGGVGVVGAGSAVIINDGNIIGGTRSNGLLNTTAVSFSGGNNLLELRSNSSIIGNVLGGATDTLALGGSTNASFDVAQIGAAVQYRGFGAYHKLGSSTWTLTGTTTAVTPWTLYEGILSVSADGNLGAASGGLTFNGGTLEVTGTAYSGTSRAMTMATGGGGIDIDDAANIFTISSVITGAGGLTKLGDGTLVFTADNTYAGGTTIAAGTLQLGNGGTAGGIVSGSLLNNGALVINRSNDMAIAGDISGSGSVAQVGSGVTTLSGTNTYTGGTTITAGTLQLGNGGTTGSIVGDVANDGTLIFNRSNQYDYAGIISGLGKINQNGSGLTMLTGNSSGFTGTTNVNAGTLSVNGILGGTMNVNGGRLQGTGQVGDTTNFAGGTIAPGNSIGTLLVAGNYTGSGGVLEMEAVLAGSGSPADRLLITGNATGNTIVNVINTGGSGAGTGTSNTDGISIIQVGGTSSVSTFQLAGGYAAVGAFQYTLNAFDPTASAAGEIDPLLGAVPFWDYRLQSLIDSSGKPVAVPQVAGYQAMPTGAVRYGASLLDSVHKRLGELRETATQQNKIGNTERSKEVFLRTQGSSNDVSGNSASGYDQDIWYVQAGGNLFGRDMADGAELRIGGALSIGGSKLNADESSAKVDLRGTTLALTSTYQAATGWYLDAVAQGTRYTSEITTSQRGETGDPKGWGWGLSLEGGYPFDMGNGLILEPQAQLTYQRIRFDKFTDVDRIDVDLNGGESLRGRFGGRMLKTITTNIDRQWTPYIEANLLHEFLSDGSITASNVRFDSESMGTSLQLGGGLNARLGLNSSVFASLSYEKGLTSASADVWGGNVGVRVDF